MELPYFLEHLRSTIEHVLNIFGNTAHAASFPMINPDENLGFFIRNLYTFAIGIVGLAVFVQFLRAGFSYFLAAGNISETINAKSMMQNAILGGILLLSAYLILNVINPDLTNVALVTPSLPPPPPKSELVKKYEPLGVSGITAEEEVGVENLDRGTRLSIMSIQADCRCIVDILSQQVSADGVRLVLTGNDELYDYVKGLPKLQEVGAAEGEEGWIYEDKTAKIQYTMFSKCEEGVGCGGTREVTVRIFQ